MKALVLAAALLCVAGCRAPEVRTVEVKVPVAVPCPEPPILLWPVLPTDQITPETSDAEVAKAYAAERLYLRGLLAEAYAILNGYRFKSTRTVIPQEVKR
jgi:hypothetical protein